MVFLLRQEPVLIIACVCLFWLSLAQTTPVKPLVMEQPLISVNSSTIRKSSCL